MIRLEFDVRAFDCLSEIIKVTRAADSLVAVTLTYLLI